MRPRNVAARDRLIAVLGRASPARAADLAQTLNVSVPTLHRLLGEVSDQVVSAGSARRARHALRRDLRGSLAPLPLYEVDASGRAALLSRLTLVRPQGSSMPLDGSGWPVPDDSRDGWWPALPFPLYDMRPQGYLGRQLAQSEHRALGVSPDPGTWSDSDIVHVLARVGSDTSGSLILGDPAFERWQATRGEPPAPLTPRGAATAYVRLAERTVAGGVAGSSAAGDFPKFTAWRERAGSATPHVLVKFSGADDAAAVRRWSDLLVAEHLALESLADGSVAASASSRVLTLAGRTFLEVERFDRQGLFGRSRLVSLETLDASLVGDGRSDWSLVATRLAAAGLLDAEDAARIDRLWWFGRLIANTDMHAGNLSFVPNGRLVLAPAYDMLPMHYAPLPGGELPARPFEPPLPRPTQRAAWSDACRAATTFWDRVALDRRIGQSFRRIGANNALQLRRLADRL